MIKFTTPDITLTVDGIELDASDRVWVTMRQGSGSHYAGDPIEIEPASFEVTGGSTVMTVSLTQQETGDLEVGPISVQVNWMTSAGKRGATDIVNAYVTPNLLDEVKSYGE